MSLILPDVREVKSVLDILTGANLNLKEDPSPKVPRLDHPQRGMSISFWSDDEGKQVGAVIADLTATVSLGAALMMVPPAGQQEQIRSGAASQMVIDAFSEVINTLTSAINGAQQNPHVRSMSVTRYEGAKGDAAWLASPAERHDILGTFPSGVGRLILLAR